MFFMCLLVVQKPNAKMSNKQIENAWIRNSDGSGYSFCKDNKIITKKYMDLNDFKSNLNNDWNSNKDKVFLIHFRYATHGITDVSNVHPFKVNNGLVFGHNGVINCVDDDNQLSDTQVFNNTILKNLKNGFLKNDAIKKLISESIGNSKLAFLDNQNRYTIINSYLGNWNQNKSIWFSNDSHKKSKVVVYGGNYNGWSKYNHIQNDFKFDEENTKSKRCDWCLSDSVDYGVNQNGTVVCDTCDDDFKSYNI